jgi:hypothetical protein
MPIIDAHMHTQFLPIDKENAAVCGTDCTEAGLERELKDADIEWFVSIGSDFDEPTPMGLDYLKAQRKRFPNLIPVLGVNPGKTTRLGLARLDDALAQGDAAGIKIYPGYYPFAPTAQVYEDIYRIAERHACPVIIHTGDTLVKDGLIKYTNPIEVDELAVRFRGVPFVIAHLGNPWIREAAEVIYKNANVYGDLSALTIGSVTFARDRFLTMDSIKYALDYTGMPEKFMFGSDWPLCHSRQYADLVKSAMNTSEWTQVSYDTAAKLYKLPARSKP